MLDSTSSVNFIESKFPALSQELHEECWDGLLHMQIAIFARWAQNWIDAGDKDLWNQVTEVFMDIWQDCTPDVINALNVSFLENLNFVDRKKQRSWAYVSMPNQMRQAWDKMDSYNRKIHGN